MNRRIVLIFLILACLFVSFDSFAIEVNKKEGDFSILNGIQLGMSLQQIEQCMGRKSEHGVNEFESVSFKEETIGGIPIGEMAHNNVRFQFDSKAKVNCTNIGFWSGYYDGQYDSTKRSFKALCDGLSSKYGKSFTPTDANFFSKFSNDHYNTLFGNNLIDAKEWIVEYENYYVVIFATLTFQIYRDSSSFNISYNLVSRSEMDEYFNPKTPSIDLNGL